jgi:hypothetical protein
MQAVTIKAAEGHVQELLLEPDLDFTDFAVKVLALPSMSTKSDDSVTPSVVATLRMFSKLKLLSPRSTVPMKVRCTPHLSAKASCE